MNRKTTTVGLQGNGSATITQAGATITVVLTAPGRVPQTETYGPSDPEFQLFAGALERRKPIQSVKRVRLQSSWIVSAGYDPNSRRLVIEVDEDQAPWAGSYRSEGRRGNWLYIYENVPSETWVGLSTAESHGRYFNNHIRGQFASNRQAN